jgi:Na+/H+ antiporter NhaA
MSEKPRQGLWPFILENYLLLVTGTVIALLWANLSHSSYEQFAHILHFPVNDIGMAFFFALATKEIIEATLPGGALASPREAGVPLLAAVDGMAGPAAVYAWQVTTADRPGADGGVGYSMRNRHRILLHGRPSNISPKPSCKSFPAAAGDC